jgi:hypothetical protein
MSVTTYANPVAVTASEPTVVEPHSLHAIPFNVQLEPWRAGAIIIPFRLGTADQQWQQQLSWQNLLHNPNAMAPLCHPLQLAYQPHHASAAGFVTPHNSFHIQNTVPFLPPYYAVSPPVPSAVIPLDSSRVPMGPCQVGSIPLGAPAFANLRVADHAPQTAPSVISLSSSPQASPQHAMVGEGSERSTTQLIVNYLDNEVTGAELLRIFSAYGPVESARVMYDPKTNHTLGYGFVYFVSPGDAAVAVRKLNRYQLRKKRLRVAFANRLKHELGTPQPHTKPTPNSLTSGSEYGVHRFNRHLSSGSGSG